MESKLKPEFTFNESAFKHGVTEDDIKSALETFVFEGAIEDEDEKLLVIGFDTNGNLLEVMYNITEENIGNIFHAMKCRKQFMGLIER